MIVPTVVASPATSPSTVQVADWAGDRVNVARPPTGTSAASGERSAGKIREALGVLLGGQTGARVEYIALVHPDTLEPVERLTGRVVVALAVWIGGTRLIDNAVIEVENE